MTLRGILSVVQVAAVLAYAGLAVRLYRSGRILSLPCFTVYAGLMVVDLIWHPLTVREVMWIEPWLLCLRFLSVLEAARLALDYIAPGQRRYFLLFLICAGVAAAIRVAGYFNLADLGGWYRTMSQCVHVGLAAGCVAGNLYERFAGGDVCWDPLWLPPLRLLSLYIVGRAVVSFVVPGRGLAAHQLVRIEWLAFVCAWAAVWAWYDRRELRSSRLQRLDARL